LYNFRRRLRAHQGTFVVTLTRIAPGLLDGHDNLPRSLKACVDEIAAVLDVDDKDARVEWRYGQEQGKRGEYAVRVHIEAEEAAGAGN